MSRSKKRILILLAALAIGSAYAKAPDFSDANPGADPRPDPSTIDYDIGDSLSLADNVP